MAKYRGPDVVKVTEDFSEFLALRRLQSLDDGTPPRSPTTAIWSAAGVPTSSTVPTTRNVSKALQNEMKLSQMLSQFQLREIVLLPRAGVCSTVTISGRCPQTKKDKSRRRHGIAHSIAESEDQEKAKLAAAGFFILAPESPVRRSIDICCLVLVIIDVFHIPLSSAFAGMYPETFDTVLELIWANAVTAFFVVDLISHFFTAYRDSETGVLVVNRRAIAHRYARTWLLLNVIASLPYDAYTARGSKNLRLLRIGRVFRLSRALARFWKGTKTGNALFESVVLTKYGVLLSLGQAVGLLCVILHWVNCVFVFAVAMENTQGDDNWLARHELVEDDGATPTVCLSTMYKECLYLTSLMLLHGEDPDTTTSDQRIMALVFSLFGIGVVAHLFGVIITIVESLTASSLEYNNKMRRLRTDMKFLGLPRSLQIRIRRYYDYVWNEFGCFNDHDGRTDKFLAELSKPLRTEVGLYRHLQTIQTVPLLTQCPPKVVREVLELWKTQVFLPRDFVIRCGDCSDSFFVLSKGTCEMFDKAGAEQGSIESGDFFGTDSILDHHYSEVTVKAVTFCNFFVLSRVSMNRIRHRYPEYDKALKHVLRMRNKRKDNSNNNTGGDDGGNKSDGDGSDGDGSDGDGSDGGDDDDDQYQPHADAHRGREEYSSLESSREFLGSGSLDGAGGIGVVLRDHGRALKSLQIQAAATTNAIRKVDEKLKRVLTQLGHMHR